MSQLAFYGLDSTQCSAALERNNLVLIHDLYIIFYLSNIWTWNNENQMYNTLF